MSLRTAAPWSRTRSTTGGFGHSLEAPADWTEPEASKRDCKKLFLVVGLGALSWVATYVGMLELIEANMGDLPLVHKLIIGFSVAMLMIMIIWLLDQMFAPVDCLHPGSATSPATSSCRSSRSGSASASTGRCWRAAARPRARPKAPSRQVQSVAVRRLDAARAAAVDARSSSPPCRPRRPRSSATAARPAPTAARATARAARCARTTPRASSSPPTSSRAASARSRRDMARARCRPAEDRQGRPLRSIDAKTGTRNEFLRGARPQARPDGDRLQRLPHRPAAQADPRRPRRARRAAPPFADAKGGSISCPDAQLQMALRGVVRAIDQLPELEKPKIAAVEGSEATIEAFRRLTTTFFGLLSFKLPPSADELRELQKKAVQSVESPARRCAAASATPSRRGLAKRDYVPLAVADLRRPVPAARLDRPADEPLRRPRARACARPSAGRSIPILSRFHDIHADADAMRHFEVFRDVIFDVNGHYHVAVPLNVPHGHADNCEAAAPRGADARQPVLRAGGPGHPDAARELPAGLVAQRQLKRPGSKFVECYAQRTSRPFRAPGGRCGHVHVRSQARSAPPSRSTASRRAPGRR